MYIYISVSIWLLQISWICFGFHSIEIIRIALGNFSVKPNIHSQAKSLWKLKGQKEWGRSSKNGSVSQILTLYRYCFFFANIIKETHSCVVGSFSLWIRHRRLTLSLLPIWLLGLCLVHWRCIVLWFCNTGKSFVQPLIFSCSLPLCFGAVQEAWCISYSALLL